MIYSRIAHRAWSDNRAIRAAAAIDRHGWPRRSDVGKDAATAAWLLAQHADHDPDFQRRCLGLLEQAVEDGKPSRPTWPT